MSRNPPLCGLWQVVAARVVAHDLGRCARGGFRRMRYLFARLG
jgi:hypothetical protein